MPDGRLEDAGWSDRAYEVADLCEHISVWGPDDAASDLLAETCDATAAERVQLVSARRLFRLFWLDLLMPGRPASRRNPAGTLERQAARVLDSLG